MLSNWIRQLFILIIIGTLLSSCVSVEIDKPSIKRSADVSFVAPKGRFKDFESSHLDAAWKNSENGNSISFLSDCNAENDPVHQTIRDGIVGGLTDLKIISEEMIDYNKRRALISKVSGTVDGVETFFEILILKKNSCIYVLTYVGLEDGFPKDHGEFLKFREGFQAP